MSVKRVFTVLGGGSVWTPYFILQLAEHSLVNGLQIRLQGFTHSHLLEVMNFTRCFVREPLDIKVIANLEEAIEGASIILNQARIGGWCARLFDEVFPVQMGGIGDESLGFGGLLAAVRTWPFVVKVSRIIRQHAPGAWVLNLTNPSDLVSRAWREAGCQRVLSLCEHPQTLARELAILAEKPEVAFRFGFIGMTHVGWLVPPPGMQLYPLLRKRPELVSWYREWGALPTTWRIRMIDPVSIADEQQLHPGLRARQLKRLVENLREVIRSKDQDRYWALLDKRKPVWYTEVVVPAIRGLLEGEPVRLIVGLPNKRRLPGMADDVIVESWAVIERDGVHPEPFPENLLCQQDVVDFGHLRTLAFKAMMHPNRHLLARYVRSDPFTRSIVSKGNLDRLLHDLNKYKKYYP